MHIGIVGAGISGVTLQHYLNREGVESTVFEATADPGGVIDSRRIDGRIVENGPQRTRLSPPVASLVESLDIGDRVVEAADAPLYVYRDGALRRVPFSIREGFSTDLLSWRGKLRLLLEPLTGPPRDEESVEESLTRMGGPEVAQYVVGPLYGGIYGTHPDEMLMEHSLGRALEKYGVGRSLLVAALRAKLRRSEAPPVVSFDDGLQTLPRALAARHREAVHLETPVESLRERGDQFELETPDGTTVVGQVVLTTPADVTATLLEEVAPATAASLQRLGYNPLALVHLAAESGIDASGFQVQYEEAFSTLGVTCNATLFDREGLHTAFLGGAKNPGLVDQPPSAIREVAEREFADLTGIEATALDVQRLPRGMPAYDTTWTALSAVDPPDGIHLCANYESRAGIPGRVGEAKRLADRLSEAAGVDA